MNTKEIIDCFPNRSDHNIKAHQRYLANHSPLRILDINKIRNPDQGISYGGFVSEKGGFIGVLQDGKRTILFGFYKESNSHNGGCITVFIDQNEEVVLETSYVLSGIRTIINKIEKLQSINHSYPTPVEIPKKALSVAKELVPEYIEQLDTNTHLRHALEAVRAGDAPNGLNIDVSVDQYLMDPDQCKKQWVRILYRTLNTRLLSASSDSVRRVVEQLNTMGFDPLACMDQALGVISKKGEIINKNAHAEVLQAIWFDDLVYNRPHILDGLMQWHCVEPGEQGVAFPSQINIFVPNGTGVVKSNAKIPSSLLHTAFMIRKDKPWTVIIKYLKQNEPPLAAFVYFAINRRKNELIKCLYHNSWLSRIEKLPLFFQKQIVKMAKKWRQNEGKGIINDINFTSLVTATTL